MHISYKPLWHTLLERDMRKEDLRLAAGMTTNMIANMSKEGKHISMDTLARICETLNCEITDVIELVPDEPASTGGKEHERTETKNHGKRNLLYPCRRLLYPGFEAAKGTPPYWKVRTDAQGIFKGSPPSQIEHIDLDRGVMDIPCRPERTGTGTVRHHHRADERCRGRDRGIETNPRNGMGAALQ